MSLFLGEEAEVPFDAPKSSAASLSWAAMLRYNHFTSGLASGARWCITSAGLESFSIAWVFELETPDYQALELDKNAGNLWTEQIPLIADCLHREAKFRSKSKHAPAKGEAGEKR